MEIELDRLVGALPAQVWTALPDGRAEFVNQRWSEYTGLSHDEAVGLGWQQAIHPDDLPRLLEHWRVFVDACSSGEAEARLRRHDGVYRRFLFSVAPLKDEAGRLIKWCGINTDIEDSVQAVDEIREREAQFRSIVDGLPAMVTLSSPEGDLELANRHVVEFFGAPLEEMKSWTQGEVFHPDDYPGVLAAWRRARATEGPFDHEARMRQADGEYRWFRLRGFPLCDIAGRIAHWYFLHDQIEDAKRVEAELRQANSFLTEAQRLSRTGSFIWDVMRDEHNWSEELYRIWGLEAYPRVTTPLLMTVIHPEDTQAVEDNIARAMDGRDFDLSFRILAPDGAVRHARVVAHRIAQITDRPVFIGAMQDVTASKVAEEALNRARDELAHVARVTALSALTASIAHEVNQPLAGIITNASTCLRMLAADPPNLDGARATAQRTIRDGNRASDVIQRLRALFTRKPPATERVDLNDAAREVAALSASELQRNRIALRTDFAEGLPPVCGDRVQLQQVILNLILNAREAMKEVYERARILQLATSPDAAGRAALTVRDTGVGLGSQNPERLFDSFYTTKPEGMGIGLAISRSIIESHGGRLWASGNGDGPGATFAFALPPAADAPCPGEHAEAPAPKPAADAAITQGRADAP
jgi:PAS domain S-box-containing protein